MIKLHNYDITMMCIKNEWFYSGTIEQYKKMFDLAEKEETTVHELAIAIWLCTDDTDLEDIEDKLNKANEDRKKALNAE